MVNIATYLKELVCDALRGDLIILFTYVYGSMYDIREILTLTPDNWHDGRIADFIKLIQENITLPIAALIMTSCLAAEIYHIVIEKNQMKEVDISALMTLFIKITVCLILVVNALRIVNGVFELGNWATKQTMSIVSIAKEAPEDLADQVVAALMADEGITFWMCLGFWLNVTLYTWGFLIINAIAYVVVYGRLIQMVLYASFGPIPLATFLNKDWNVGQNYIKNLMALAFQGFLIILIYGIYSIIISVPPKIDTNDFVTVQKYIVEQLFSGILLCMTLTKTNSITQSIFGAH